jgi:hypothetical protein
MYRHANACVGFQELDDAGWHVARLHPEEAKIRNRL